MLNVVQADEIGVRHHHGHARPAGEARAVRQGPRRVLAGDRADVPRRRPSGGLPAVSAERVTPALADGADPERLGSPLGRLRRGRRGQPGQRSTGVGWCCKLLGRPPAGSTVLDIGSGQGEFALAPRSGPTRTCGVCGRRIQRRRACAAATARAAARGPRGPVPQRRSARARPRWPMGSSWRLTRSAPRCSSTSTTRRCCCATRGVARAGLPGGHYRAGRPAVGVRQAHRPFPAFHRRTRCAGRADGRGLDGRPGSARGFSVLQPVQAGGHRPRQNG